MSGAYDRFIDGFIYGSMVMQLSQAVERRVLDEVILPSDTDWRLLIGKLCPDSANMIGYQLAVAVACAKQRDKIDITVTAFRMLDACAGGASIESHFARN